MSPRLIDTHQHAWDLAQFSYGWCAASPALNRSFPFSAYADAARGCGIAGTVFVECDVDEPLAAAEAGHVQAVADAPPAGLPPILGIVAACRPERGDFDHQLEVLRKLPRLRGVRRVLHTQGDGLGLEPAFIANVRRLAAAGLSFDLCVLPRQLPVAINLARQCPAVTFILDHCGIPDVKAGTAGLDPWRELLRALAQSPNVHAKLSGLIAYARPGHWSVDDLRPWVEHTIDCFGWRRVLWGGDWPVCTLNGRLADWVDAARKLVASASADEQARLFYRNAEAVYRISLP